MTRELKEIREELQASVEATKLLREELTAAKSTEYVGNVYRDAAGNKFKVLKIYEADDGEVFAKCTQTSKAALSIKALELMTTE